MDILLADDHRPTREAMAELIEKQPDLRLVGQATGGREAVDQAERLRPGVIIMDLAMPGMNGIEATRILRAHRADLRILVLSNHTGGRLVRALRQAGATGYVRKDQAYEELIPAIRAVAEGRVYLGKGVEVA